MLRSLILAACAVGAASDACSEKWDGKTFLRTEVEPSDCAQPTNCAYQCSAQYDATVTGDVVKFVSTASAVSSSCICYELLATRADAENDCEELEGGAAEDGTEFTVDWTASKVTISTSTQGVSCGATYTSGSISNSASPAVTMAVAAFGVLAASGFIF